jgi:hypothetical protein
MSHRSLWWHGAADPTTGSKPWIVQWQLIKFYVMENWPSFCKLIQQIRESNFDEIWCTTLKMVPNNSEHFCGPIVLSKARACQTLGAQYRLAGDRRRLDDQGGCLGRHGPGWYRDRNPAFATY